MHQTEGERRDKFSEELLSDVTDAVGHCENTPDRYLTLHNEWPKEG